MDDRIRLRIRTAALARAFRDAGDVRAAQLDAIQAGLRLGGEDPPRPEVTAPVPDAGEADLTTRIKDDSDTIVQILGSVPPTDPMRRNIQQLYNQIRSLQNAVRKVGTDLYGAVGTEETKELDQSGVGELRNAFADAARDLDPLLKAFSILRGLESKIKTDQTVGPVQHQLPVRSKREIEKQTIRTKKPTT